MGIMAIRTKHPFQVLMHLIPQDTFSLVTIKTERLVCQLQQLFVLRSVRIVTSGTIAPGYRSMQVRILPGQIFMTDITEPRLGFNHVTQRLLIVTGRTLPLSVRVVYEALRI